MAPMGPVAMAKRPGRLNMPAPTMEPTTTATNAGSDSRPCFSSAMEKPCEELNGDGL